MKTARRPKSARRQPRLKIAVQQLRDLASTDSFGVVLDIIEAAHDRHQPRHVLRLPTRLPILKVQ